MFRFPAVFLTVLLGAALGAVLWNFIEFHLGVQETWLNDFLGAVAGGYLTASLGSALRQLERDHPRFVNAASVWTVTAMGMACGGLVRPGSDISEVFSGVLIGGLTTTSVAALLSTKSRAATSVTAA